MERGQREQSQCKTLRGIPAKEEVGAGSVRSSGWRLLCTELSAHALKSLSKSRLRIANSKSAW